MPSATQADTSPDFIAVSADTPDELPQQRLWTRVEYYRMAEAGMFEGQRVELIAGEILLMSPQGNPHSVALAVTAETLSDAFGRAFWVRQQLPLRGADNTDPEPDLAVVPGRPRSYTEHPNTALLVVEIAAATVLFDRRTKASLYASMGIEDYWIVNLPDRQLEVHRRPQPDAAQLFGHSYADRFLAPATGVVTPLALPEKLIAVADLLP